MHDFEKNVIIYTFAQKTWLPLVKKGSTTVLSVTLPNVDLFSKFLQQHQHPFNGTLSETTGWACTRKVKPIWIYCSKRQWVAMATANHMQIYTWIPGPRQITMPAPHHSVFTGQMPVNVIKFVRTTKVVIKGPSTQSCEIFRPAVD